MGKDVNQEQKEHNFNNCSNGQIDEIENSNSLNLSEEESHDHFLTRRMMHLEIFQKFDVVRDP